MTRHFDGTQTSGNGLTVAHFDLENALMEVKLTPFGPFVTPEAGAPFQDSRIPDKRQLVNRGNATIPYVQAPFVFNSSSPTAHIPYGGGVEVAWDHINQATGYLVHTYPITHSTA